MLVDGWPIHWCQSSNCLRACNAFDVHMVVHDDILDGVASLFVLLDDMLVSLCDMEEMASCGCHCCRKSGILLLSSSRSSSSTSS